MFLNSKVVSPPSVLAWLQSLSVIRIPTLVFCQLVRDGKYRGQFHELFLALLPNYLHSMLNFWEALCSVKVQRRAWKRLAFSTNNLLSDPRSQINFFFQKRITFTCNCTICPQSSWPWGCLESLKLPWSLPELMSPGKTSFGWQPCSKVSTT